jgi:hypothetical protein
MTAQELGTRRWWALGAVCLAVLAVGVDGTVLSVALPTLGSILTAGYLAHVSGSGLPRSSALAVRASVFGGVAVAKQIDSTSLLASVRSAFVHGMNPALQASAAIALGGAVLAVLFLPRTNAGSAPRAAEPVGPGEELQVVGAR